MSCKNQKMLVQLLKQFRCLIEIKNVANLNFQKKVGELNRLEKVIFNQKKRHSRKTPHTIVSECQCKSAEHSDYPTRGTNTFKCSDVRDLQNSTIELPTFSLLKQNIVLQYEY